MSEKKGCSKTCQPLQYTKWNCTQTLYKTVLKLWVRGIATGTFWKCIFCSNIYLPGLNKHPGEYKNLDNYQKAIKHDCNYFSFTIIG